MMCVQHIFYIILAVSNFVLLITNLHERVFTPPISPCIVSEWRKHDSDEIKIVFEFSFHVHQEDAHIFLSCLNPKIFDLMFEHLQQPTHLFLLEFDGASTSCICVICKYICENICS